MSDIQVNFCDVETFKFSGGEISVKLKNIFQNRFLEPGKFYSADPNEPITIKTNLFNSDDVMELLMVHDAIINNNNNGDIHLTIPYFPYARQDRVCADGESFSVRVMANLINTMNCATVTVVDPHSDVTPALINNCRIISQAEVIKTTKILRELFEDKNVVLVSPDAGAEKKVLKTAQEFKLEMITASKIRDVETGNIVKTQLHCDDLEGKDCFILDDICDGGRTFIELAKVLKEKNAGKIMLYVTHGIFSKGIDVFDDLVDEIFVFNLFDNEMKNNDKVTMI